MQVSELLDELRTNILRDISNRVAGPEDRLWSDETLIRYMNEAYFRFCRLSLSLVDRTSPITKVTLTATQDIYTLDQSILGLVSARLAGEPADLARTGHGVLDTPIRTEDSLYFDVNLLAALPPGKPLACATDEEDASFRVYPVPSADYDGQIINLRIIRMPVDKLSLDNLDAELEIREEWQLGMLDWAAYRALSNNDVDTEDSGKVGDGRTDNDRAGRRKKSFEDTIADAMREARRRRFAGTAWSFGRYGFAYIK